MNVDIYNRMFEEQGGVCLICGNPETHSRNTHLSVDHNHKTGAIRALLCSKCNTGLGHHELNKDAYENYLSKFTGGSNGYN